jgi:hypothetical protein
MLLGMEDPDLATYAKGIAGALRVIGPTPREQVLGMLAALHLLPVEQVAVIDYALANGILAADGDVLRAIGQSGSMQAVR